MKTVFLILAGLCLSAFTATAQILNHPVIEKVQVMYKPDKAVSGAVHEVSSPNIKVKGTTNITLKNDSKAVKIYLKIKDKQTQALVYEVNYVISSSDIFDQGMILYKKQGNVLSITNPATIALKPYVYELYTEDAAGGKSNVYTIIQ